MCARGKSRVGRKSVKVGSLGAVTKREGIDIECTTPTVFPLLPPPYTFAFLVTEERRKIPLIVHLSFFPVERPPLCDRRKRKEEERWSKKSLHHPPRRVFLFVVSFQREE